MDRRTTIVFLTKYVCRSSVDFLGPIGERYAGLYYSFMERFRQDYDFYWYSADEATAFEYRPDSNDLRPLSTLQGRRSRIGMGRLLISFCFRNYRARKLFIVSYPYFPGGLTIAVLLFLLKPFRVTTVIDVQDLPWNIPWTRSYIIWWFVNQLYYRHALFIVNSAECAKLYGRRAHGRIFVIPMAAHHHLITPRSSPCKRGRLTLGYVGTIDKRRGFPDVIELVKELRAEGLDIDLIINGSGPEDIDLGKYPWVQLYERQPLGKFAELLHGMDVGVIPYVDRKYWGLMSITKMATYMAAGLPILSLHLTETKNILAKWECGISVDDWDGFGAAVKMLCEDKALRERLGQNARRAAVQEYNWVTQVEKLGEFIGKWET